MAGYAHYPSLRRRHVFITGGATGIGASLVGAFAWQGAVVTFIDVAREAGEALAARLGDAVDFISCDVTQPDALQAALDAAAAKRGPVAVLVNNVANDQRRTAAGTDAAAWRAGLAVNLDPTFLESRRDPRQPARRITPLSGQCPRALRVRLERL